MWVGSEHAEAGRVDPPVVCVMGTAVHSCAGA
jgi:hypothetical protein